MEYREVTIYTTTQGIEPLTLMLNDLGINGFVIEDAADFEEFITEVTPHWDYVDESLMSKRDAESNVKIYLPDNDQGVEQLAMVTEAVEKLKASGEDFGRLELVLNQVKDEDWANNWKRFFKPLKVGEKFLIKPSWEDCPDTEGRHVLEIDPGNAFGSGTHETTKLCIGLLEGVVKEGADAVGSGAFVGSFVGSAVGSAVGSGVATSSPVGAVVVVTSGTSAPVLLVSSFWHAVIQNNSVRQKSTAIHFFVPFFIPSLSFLLTCPIKKFSCETFRIRLIPQRF